MLIEAKTIEGFKLQATDGDIGEVHDILFDDAEWVVRYFVVNTGSWLNRERVLLSPESVTQVNTDDRRLHVALTRRQVKDSPDVSSDIPVSRQEEERLRSYYAWPVYWGGTGMGAGFGASVTPAVVPSAEAAWTMRGAAPGTSEEAEALAPPPARESEPRGDSHLRSVRELRNYALSAVDGEIGHLEDVVLKDGRWTVHHVLIDTTNWWPGGHVVISPMQIREVRWADRTVAVNLTREEVKHAPDSVAAEHR